MHAQRQQIEGAPAGPVVVACALPNASREIASLLDAAGLPRRGVEHVEGVDMQLVATSEGLELRVLTGSGAGGRAVRVDLAKLDTTSGPGRALGQPLLKAVGIKRGGSYRPVVIDACAGLGEDAWLLASFGCRVLAIERQPIVAAMLTDALRRAARAHADVAQRVSTVAGDACEALQTPNELPASFVQPDVIYLDPMYPGHGQRRAAERKPMRILRRLVGDDADAGRLFRAAMAVARRRVVVKRPPRAKAITAVLEPASVHKGRGYRFDVYVPSLGT
jgi:16S rRNA (guanine1516-N2)-methyltransferase